MSDEPKQKQSDISTPEIVKLSGTAPAPKLPNLFRENLLNILAEIAGSINDVNETLQDICIRLED